MISVIDPLLILQLIATVLIVLTLPDSSEEHRPEETQMPADRKPFQLSDGNTYVQHAGMAVDAEKLRSLNLAC